MGISVPSWINVARKPPALHRKTLSQNLQSKTSLRGLPRRKVASSQMHLYHAAGLEVAADLQLTNTSQRTRRRILPLGEMTIKKTADMNTEAGLSLLIRKKIKKQIPVQTSKKSPQAQRVLKKFFPFTFF